MTVNRFEIDEPLVRSLVRAQHPDLADLELRPVAGGWDNQLWRLGDHLAVRLPRSQRAPSLLHKEQRWLPVLASRLPLPVPVPVRDGEPSALFPMPWAVTTWVPGEPADRIPISRGPHAAETLAGFLRALHVRAPAGAPANPKRGVPLGAVATEFEQKLEAVDAGVEVADVRSVWNDGVTAPGWNGPPVWIHGDLHPANVVTSAGTLSGVLDFGELCAGDPATDLAAAWLLLPAGTASHFFASYAIADDATVRRARAWAVLRGVSLIGIGQAAERGLPGGQPTWGSAGRATLDRVLAAG
ncbi:Predicted kinase, aminoglycoside phosphotransferase (APT) family [Actinopolymorpha cephalotaxi]|uniref:Aminoglycoside phosphotransferase (APT) family kinase protein n=1 Tax=Actinopolymorpha cephalotaxi TaxID=504797 RepID=A0A1I2WX09_9ACTN|nr:aminoglycoside phosphotransferase family protein [Actinopolymorpha cephalotaxi]NYH85179.1 aminoglycoside phosphotransferase (APT) family kinase protein [Actinopolymorpha cephalotaxi]SFH05874.1 Predicted kinase, aminoglycoside phosphotransferase (APT) family [Actinopolymorpha cephalotaxi]